MTPVEERLRRGLEANAVAFVPEGERRLAQVHRRHRTRTAVLGSVVAVGVAVSVGVAGSLGGGSVGRGSGPAPGPAQRPTQTATTADAGAGARIPDSGWRKVVTRAQLVGAGADRAFLVDNLGHRDRLPTTLSFIGEVFSLSGRYPGGWAVGDAGTLDYAPNDRLVLTSTAPGCRGCRMTLTWRIRGDRLELRGLRSSPDDPMARVMLEGIWKRSDG